MDRIVIIGNGFDLAHGLKTGYSDFFDYLKDSIAYFKKLDVNQHRPITNGIFSSIEPDLVHRKLENGTKCKWICAKQIKSTYKYQLTANSESNSVYFKSLFSDYSGKGYWSDLEHHYFKVLNEYKDTESDVKIINEEFEYLKILLEDYLKTEVEDKIDKKVNMDNPIYQMILKNSQLSHKFKNNYFVTFNYTSKYLNEYLHYLQTYYNDATKDKFKTKPIHMHGALENEKNPIILGYGDENSEDYKELELSGNNALLKNFKTFQYLRTSKYAEVLGLLEGKEDIYVQVIGQSCGLCDKALLRTIFQHDNVKHIEAVYYKDDSKYFENLYNISRIFDDNTKMRERMVSLDDTFMIPTKPKDIS